MPHLQIHLNNIQKQNENLSKGKGNRIENIKLESELESKRNLARIKINEKKEEINSIIESICKVEKEISDINMDIELQNNYGKNSNILSQIADIEKQQKKPIGKKGALANFGRSLLMMSSLRVIIFSLDKKLIKSKKIL